jgi:hypothetical protein
LLSLLNLRRACSTCCIPGYYRPAERRQGQRQNGDAQQNALLQTVQQFPLSRTRRRLLEQVSIGAWWRGVRHDESHSAETVR